MFVHIEDNIRVLGLPLVVAFEGFDLVDGIRTAKLLLVL
jgi:hypothetical protein